MRSLRTTLLLGLAAIAVAIVGGFAGIVYARSHRQARAETESRLRLHAETLASLLEVGRDGIEFEAKPDALPGFRCASVEVMRLHRQCLARASLARRSPTEDARPATGDGPRRPTASCSA